jgi:hypothetical protein
MLREQTINFLQTVVVFLLTNAISVVVTAYGNATRQCIESQDRTGDERRAAKDRGHGQPANLTGRLESRPPSPCSG